MAVIVAVRFIGTRLVLFEFRPDENIVEQISWKTNVMRSRDQTEQRHALRVRPRQTVQFDIDLEFPEDTDELRTILFDQQTLLMGVPQWWDLRTITNTVELPIGTTVIPCNPDDAMFAAGGSAVIVTPDREGLDVVIDSIQAGVSITLSQPSAIAIPVGSEIMPLGTGFVDSVPSFDDARVNHDTTKMKFLMTSSEDIAFSEAEFLASGFTKHPVDSKLVLDTPNLVDNRYRHKMAFGQTRLDNDVGVIVQFPTDVIGTPTRPNRRSLKTVSEVWQFKKLMHYLRGSWRSFYMPTFHPDLVFNAATFDLANTTIVIKTIGASRTPLQTPHRDVFLRVSDGRQFTRRVSGVIDNGDGTESVSITAAFDASEVVNTSELVLSWAELVRIDGDVVTFTHERPGKAEAKFNVRGVVE